MWVPGEWSHKLSVGGFGEVRRPIDGQYLELSTPLKYGRRSRAAPHSRAVARQPLVEGRHDLLLYALEGLDIARRDGAEHDLVDTGVDELADSIDDVI